MEEKNNQQLEQMRQQLRQQEKLASLGVLSAGIAHEIQNPLNFVINFSKMSERLLADLTDVLKDNEDRIPEADREDIHDIMSDLDENLKRIYEHGERAVDIIQGILLISRGKDGERMPTDIPRMVKEYVWLAYHAMRANHKDFNVTIKEDYQLPMEPVLVIPQDVSRAVLNAMNNACYAVWHKATTATDYVPTIDITVSLSSCDEGGKMLTIAIGDNGEGMSDETRRRLFDNFFTTKPVGQGTGLGMGIIRDMIENRHGGTVGVESVLGEGTTITFKIPVTK